MFTFIMVAFVALSFPIASYLHECGHLLCAKMLGMKVNRVQIGTGKSLFSWKQGGTEVQFNLNSFLGGLTLIEDEQQFSKGKRLFFIFSGSILSFILYLIIAEIVRHVPAHNIYLVNGLYIFSVLNAYMAIVQIFPYRKDVTRDFEGYPSDGLALVHLTRVVRKDVKEREEELEKELAILKENKKNKSEKD